MGRPSSRWPLLLEAQRQVPNPFLLCQVVGLRARQLKSTGSRMLMAEAIDVALLDAAQQKLLTPEQEASFAAASRRAPQVEVEAAR